jgi:hypothetical protein
LQDGPADGQPQLPPEVQQQVAALLQEKAMLVAQLQKAQQIIGGKIIETESRERIATQTNQARILESALTSKSAIASKIVELTHDHVQREEDRRADLLHTTMTLQQEADLAAQELQQRQQEQQQQQQQSQPPTPSGQ